VVKLSMSFMIASMMIAIMENMVTNGSSDCCHGND
jgi:hypothetical protein